MGATADQNLNLNATNFTTTGTQNDYNPTGFANVATYRHTGVALITITGLVPTREGRIISLATSGAATLATTAESGSSTAANRFIHAISLSVTMGARLHWYDPTADRWRRIGRS